MARPGNRGRLDCLAKRGRDARGPSAPRGPGKVYAVNFRDASGRDKTTVLASVSGRLPSLPSPARVGGKGEGVGAKRPPGGQVYGSQSECVAMCVHNPRPWAVRVEGRWRITNKVERSPRHAQNQASPSG